MKSAYIKIDSEDCKKKLYRYLRNQLKTMDKAYSEICVACIGTDRSTGDSLGPLVGHKLANKGIRVVGTLDNPLHAQKIDEFVKSIDENTLVIAVDASLGQMEHVGYIAVGSGPIKPGSGVNKTLPPVGDMHVIGIVNFGGFMDFMVLQNTRLSLVMRMADVIAGGIEKVLSNRRRSFEDERRRKVSATV